MGIWGRVLGVFLFWVGFAHGAASVPLTILHTNDIHSHFRPTGGPYNLGGLARLKTAVRRVQESNPHTLFLDGGDWSEGHAYYNLGGGRTAIEMMNELGYDATVVGNHDWLNGPDQLLELIRGTPPRYAMLSANLDVAPYARAEEFRARIPQYTIIQKGPVKIGIIGVATFELIYDRYLAPVRILYPFPIVRRLAEKLKNEHRVDVVVAISHNGLQTNKLIASLPHVDVVIHAHDHEKLAQPVVVTRNGKSAYIVEAEKWGRYLGKLDLLVDPVAHTVRFHRYELLQIDDTIPEDPTVNAMINRYDAELEAQYVRLGTPGLFTERVAQTEITLDDSGGRENVMGNVVADAYREFTGADVAFEQIQFTSGPLFPGWITPFDLINSLIQIYNPYTERTWTLSTMKLTGETLRRVIMLIFVIQDLVPGGLPSVSGLHAIFDPSVTDSADMGSSDDMVEEGVRLMEIGGRPVDLNREYTVAVSTGIMHAIEFIEGRFGYRVDRRDVQDTGIENWKVLKQYLSRHTPFRESDLRLGTRFQVLMPDLAIYPHDIRISRVGSRFELAVEVHNYGVLESRERSLRFGYDRTPANTVDDPNTEWVSIVRIPPIAPGRSITVRHPLTLPGPLNGEPRVPFTAELVAENTPRSVLPSVLTRPNATDLYPGNDRATVVWTR